MFKIEVCYTDFDSFDSYYCVDFLGVCLNSLEEARHCLKLAKEHYKYLEILKSTETIRSLGSTKTLVSKYKNKEWFDTSVDEDDFSYNSEHTFNFKGKSVDCFYQGVCSQLHSMKILHSSDKQDYFITGK